MKTPNDILVTCVCITFNHKAFIKKCLDGMLMQQTAFPFEIIVYDDCSTDGTREIVEEYAANNPKMIRTVLPEENQYSKLGDVVREVFVHPLVRGKYVALCEGDDFWNNPNKLQYQVDFMELHPEYSVCYHEFTIFNTKTNKLFKKTDYPIDGDFDVTRDMLDTGIGNLAQPLTMMYRMSCWHADWYKHYKDLYRDTVENFHFLREGKGRFLRFVGGQYNLQAGGVSSQMQNYDRVFLVLPTFIKMFRYTHDKVLKPKIRNTALWALRVCDEERHPEGKPRVYKLLMTLVPIIGLDVLLCRLKGDVKRMIGFKES